MTSKKSAIQSDHSVRPLRVVSVKHFPFQERCKLLIRRNKQNRPIYLSARKNIANYFGWSDNFESYIEGLVFDETTGKSYLQSPCLARSTRKPGHEWVICTSKSRGGFPAGETRRFRVSTLATLRDIAEIAYRTQVDWEWMGGPTGPRRSREQWLQIHQAYLE